MKENPLIEGSLNVKAKLMFLISSYRDPDPIISRPRLSRDSIESILPGLIGSGVAADHGRVYWSNMGFKVCNHDMGRCKTAY